MKKYIYWFNHLDTMHKSDQIVKCPQTYYTQANFKRKLYVACSHSHQGNIFLN